MDERLKRMKQSYDEIDIPDELSIAVVKGIERGKQQRLQSNTRRRSRRWIGRVSASAAALFIAFTIGINTVPAFANSLQEVPGLGQLVKILQFNKGSAGGGTIQDATDVNFITVKEQGDKESIILNFAQNGEAQQVASSFHVSFTEYPHTMTFTVGGARKFSAVKDFAALKESKRIEDAYELIPLDDSTVRFNVTFKEAVTYEVHEYKEPAQVVITIASDPEHNADRPPVYSVRTASFPYGESVGIAEEMLFGVENIRVLKDQQGLYFVEAGFYDTEAEANARMNAIKTELGYTDPLFVEKREDRQIPESIQAPAQ